MNNSTPYHHLSTSDNGYDSGNTYLSAVRSRGRFHVLFADTDAVRLFHDALQNRKGSVLFKHADIAAGGCRNNNILVHAMLLEHCICWQGRCHSTMTASLMIGCPSSEGMKFPEAVCDPRRRGDKSSGDGDRPSGDFDVFRCHPLSIPAVKFTASFCRQATNKREK